MFEVLFPLAHVCQEMRADCFPLYIATLRVGLQLRDLNRFLRTFHCTAQGAENKGVVKHFHCPNAITVYIMGFFGKANDVDNPPIDLLPLVRLGLRYPKLTRTFELAPTASQTPADRPWPYSTAPHLYNLMLQDCKDLEVFLNHASGRWGSICRDGNLAEILLHPWQPCYPTNLQLVFSKQPLGRKIDTPSVRCYLPDARRLGLEYVYNVTRLQFAMSLKDSTNGQEEDERESVNGKSV
jgi:hypothetical protein